MTLLCLTCLVLLQPAFRALLQIRAVRKKPGALSPVSFSPVLAQTMDHDEHSVSFMLIVYMYTRSLYTASGNLLNTTPCRPLQPSATNSPCAPLFAELRLGSSRLWTHLTVRGSEWSTVSVSCYPLCPPVRWYQLLRRSRRRKPTAELPGAFEWWWSAERQSQQVTWQVSFLLHELRQQKDLFDNLTLSKSPLYINFSSFQHPSVSIFSHPGGRWGEAVRDVGRSATHAAVQQSCSHRRKPTTTSSDIKTANAAEQTFNELFPFLPGHSGRGCSRVSVPRRRWVFPSGASWKPVMCFCVTLCLNSPDAEDRMNPGGDILQDCSSEHSSLTKTESDPAGDLSLPGEKSCQEKIETFFQPFPQSNLPPSHCHCSS